MTLEEIRQELEPLALRLAELSEAEQRERLAALKQSLDEEQAFLASPFVQLAEEALAEKARGETQELFTFLDELEKQPYREKE